MATRRLLIDWGKTVPASRRDGLIDGMRALLVAALASALLGCAAARPATIRDGQIVKKGFYRVAAPSGWISLQTLGRDTLTFSQMIIDARFVRCPQTQTVSVARASYRQKAAAAGPAGDADLMEMAGALVEEIHSARRNAPERRNVTVSTVTVAGLRAAQITFHAALSGGGFCDPARPLGNLTERYVLVDAGGRGLGLSNHAGLRAQRFVVFHVESPEASLPQAQPDFEAMVNSLVLVAR